MLVGKLCGHSYADMLAGGLNAVSQSLEAIIIILCVGCLIGSFEWTGTIPAVVYYGLQLISPKLFLPLACILCAAVGIAIGSAWTVTATLGIAFMAIGTTMGLNPAIILLSLSIWGSLLGFLGLIIALPLTTLLLSYYNTYVLHEGKPEESAENQNIGN